MAGFQVSPGQIQIMNHLKLPFLMTRECEHSGAIDIRSKHGINTMNDCDGRKPCFGFVSRGANLNPYPAMTAQRAVKHREREHTTMKIWFKWRKATALAGGNTMRGVQVGEKDLNIVWLDVRRRSYICRYDGKALSYAPIRR